MNAKGKLIFGLGAVGSLVALCFASSCQTTGTLYEETMMSSSAESGNSASGCPCTKEDKTRECHLSACASSCGGEDSHAGCSDTGCGGE